MKEWIIGIIIWVIATEIIFFKTDWDSTSKFFERKYISVTFGGFISFFLFWLPYNISITSIILYGVPKAPLGNIVYPWYYGILIGLSLFCGINYLIYRRLKNENNNS